MTSTNVTLENTGTYVVVEGIPVELVEVVDHFAGTSYAYKYKDEWHWCSNDERVYSKEEIMKEYAEWCV